MTKDEAISILKGRFWQKMPNADEIRTKIEANQTNKWIEALETLFHSSYHRSYQLVPDYPVGGYSCDTHLEGDMPQTVIVYGKERLKVLAQARISFTGSSNYTSNEPQR